MTIRIILERATPERFTARLAATGEPVCTSRTPILAAARMLHSLGFDPDDTLEAAWSVDGPVAVSGRIGRLAALTVAEGRTTGPRFARFTELPEDVRGGR